MKKGLIWFFGLLVGGILLGVAIGWWRFTFWPQTFADMNAGQGIPPVISSEE